MALTKEFMFQNVAYRPTVYITGAEIPSIQLDRVLGRPIPSGPFLLDHERNTNDGLNIRYRYLHSTMDNRESEIKILNQGPSANVDHTRLISSQFLRESIESDQTNQIDLSSSQADLNSNIQITYPETSVTSFTENTSGNYFTGNNESGSGSSCNDPQCHQNGECLTHSHPENDTTGNENDTTGAETENDITGNETAGTGNYRAMGEEIVSQLLVEQNVDSFALIYNDGNAHFQGSAPDSSFDLSAIEPFEGYNESYDDFDGVDEAYDLEMPIRFEKGPQQ